MFYQFLVLLNYSEQDQEYPSCSCSRQTCTNTRNTSIPPGVLSFQVVFVNKFNLMEDILLLLFSAVNEGWI